METVNPAVGAVRTYQDFTGRTQWAVDGPNGTFLVTRKHDREPWVVWPADSLRTVLRTPNLTVALERAGRAAGV